MPGGNRFVAANESKIYLIVSGLALVNNGTAYLTLFPGRG